MLNLIIFIIVVYLMFSIPILVKNYIETKKNYDFKGKINTKLLTNIEYDFYIKLKRITDKYQLLLFSKVRLADIISTNNYKDFNKIKSKHIDFIICDRATKFIKFIELDDNTHNILKNKINDEKKNIIFKKANIELIRININEQEKKLHQIDEALKIICKN